MFKKNGCRVQTDTCFAHENHSTSTKTGRKIMDKSRAGRILRGIWKDGLGTWFMATAVKSENYLDVHSS